MQQNSHAEPRRAQRESPVTNTPTSATGHPTVTDRHAIQVSFSLRVSASPREPVPAFREREAGQKYSYFGNGSPNSDRPARHPSVLSPRLRVNLSPPSIAWLRPSVLHHRGRFMLLGAPALPRSVKSVQSVDNPTAAFRFRATHRLSRVHTGAVSRGAAESAERDADHKYSYVGNGSPNGDGPAHHPSVLFPPRLRVSA